MSVLRIRVILPAVLVAVSAFAPGCGRSKTAPPGAAGAGGVTGNGGGLAGSDGVVAGNDGGLAGSDGGIAGNDGGGASPDAPAGLPLTVPLARAQAIASLESLIGDHAPTDAASFAARWSSAHVAALGYDPLAALRLDAVQASHLKLDDAELALLAKNGFALSTRQAFPSFFFGYKAVYADDLPVFISADSILHAVHRSFDAILKEVEQASLVSQTDALLRGMHEALANDDAAGLSPTARADADLFLTVARRLLEPAPPVGPAVSTIAPVAGASAALVDDLVTKARAASGLAVVPLFGEDRAVDFSQFKPRGHYVGDWILEGYFRAMIWLGRTDLRFIVHDGTAARFVRREFEAALQLSLLLDDARRASWSGIDETLRGFVGESDNMTPLDFDALGSALGVTRTAELPQQSDVALAQAITNGGFGIQRIASQILFVPPEGLNAPLDRSFLLFGQRYVLDSEVLSNVVFDRVLPGGHERRMLPNPLDVAFAALGNTHAAPLLATELAKYENYPKALHEARLLSDAHEPAFWDGSLYHSWLGALRALSPAADLTGDAGKGLPTVARTEAWSRRVLNAQLASWAELRHDTLLYAKQSYTGFPTCEYPDAYVDPYPALWAALGRYAARGLVLAGKLPPGLGTRATTYFTELATVAARLQDMSNRQLTGVPFSAEQLAWVNEAVTIKDVQQGCVIAHVPDGWYVRLFFKPDDATIVAPTIADVHTDPKDGFVLHVGTGAPRLMIVTAETCVGPRAYVGLASSYYETVTTGLARLTDDEWTTKLQASPPDVPWMQDLVR